MGDSALIKRDAVRILLADGQSVEFIARALGISARTVRRVRASLRRQARQVRHDGRELEAALGRL